MIRLDKKLSALFILVFVIFLAASIYYYNKTVQDGKDISWVDFRVYYYAGVNLEAGENIYDLNNNFFIYKYSPIFALIMNVIRFSVVTLADALIVWYIIIFLSFLVSLYLIKEIVFASRRSRPFQFFDLVPILFIFRYLILINFTKPSIIDNQWPLLIRIFDKALFYLITPIYILSLLFRRENGEKKEALLIMVLAISALLKFLLLNIDRAQINIVVMMLCLFFIYYMINEKYAISGTYLGIAIIFKLTPAIFLLYLIAKKKMKTFFSAIGTFVALLFIPSVKLGFERNITFIHDWVNVLISSDVFSEALDYKNQSFFSMMSRLFSKDSNTVIMKLEPKFLFFVIFFALILFVALLICAVILKPKNKTEKEKLVYDLSIFMIAMTLLSPVGTKATFIHLLLPICILIKNIFDRGFKDFFINTGLLITVSLFYLVSADLIGNTADTLHAYSIMTICLFILFIELIYAKFSLAH